MKVLFERVSNTQDTANSWLRLRHILTLVCVQERMWYKSVSICEDCCARESHHFKAGGTVSTGPESQKKIYKTIEYQRVDGRFPSNKLPEEMAYATNPGENQTHTWHTQEDKGSHHQAGYSH